MKKIQLKKLSMMNFRGSKNCEVDFSNITDIIGGNGTGKSRNFDAFLWCLFGKDSNDSKDCCIKSYQDGNIISKADVIVTLQLIVDNEPIEIKRCLVEDWKSIDGEDKYTGNHTECYINDVPLNVTAYTRKVNEICDATVFKMITNPAYFLNLPWKERRTQLLAMVGEVKDDDILSQNKKYKDLIEALSHKTLEEYRKELNEKRKRYQVDYNEIQPRIDQTSALMPEIKDWSAIQIKVDETKQKIASIDSQIQDVTKKWEAENQKRKELYLKISEIDRQIRTTEDKQAQKQAEQEHQFNKSKDELIQKLMFLNEKIEGQQRIIALSESQLITLQKEKSIIDNHLNNLRTEWTTISKSQWNGSLICPTCNQRLPIEAIENAKAIFNKDKSDKLNHINETGVSLKQRLNSYLTEIQDCQAKIDKGKVTVQQLSDEAADIQQQIEDYPIYQPVVPDDSAIKALQAERAKIVELTKIENQLDTDNLRNDRDKLQSELMIYLQELETKKTIEQYNKVIQELNQKGKLLAQELADIKMRTDLISDFIKEKIDACEAKINNLFSILSFKMYSQTIDGKDVEICEPYANGKPYYSANTALQLNAGLEMIKVLSDFYGIQAPIFIDNRESITDIIPIDTQIINMIVEPNKALTVINH